MGFKQQVFEAKSVVLFWQSRVQGSENYSYHLPLWSHHPLCFAPLYRSTSRVKVADAASGEGEPSDREKLRMVQQVLNRMCGSILVPPSQEMRKEEG